MARRNDDDDDEDDDCGDIPPPGGVVRKPSRWNPANFAGQAQEVLDALEVTAIDEKARGSNCSARSRAARSGTVLIHVASPTMAAATSSSRCAVSPNPMATQMR